MNILPKKRWHVRTKENIARVRKDEAEAAKEEKDRLQRIKLAEQEARTFLLKQTAKLKFNNIKAEDEIKSEPEIQNRSGHINFFKELEDGIVSFTGTNADYEKEKKEEKEKYEKQIGYLTYLGQDTVETTGKISWYNKIPDRFNKTTDITEVSVHKKLLIDPLNKIRPYISLMKSTGESSHKDVKLKRKLESSDDSTNDKLSRKVKKKKNHKKHKKYSSNEKYNEIKHVAKKHKSKKRKRLLSGSSSSSEDDKNISDSSGSKEDREMKDLTLKKLREQRLRREAEEKLRAKKHLASLRGEILPDETKCTGSNIKQKYNSQFNPHLAKQNYS